MTVAPTTGRTQRAPDAERYTVEELARKVGMSPRNIRAHQARRLLPPPTRIGRCAYYDAAHVRRLEAITLLQRQGFNLVAIEAMLGVSTPNADADALTPLLQRLGAEHPVLVYALSRHGIVGRGEDGTVRTVRPRALRSALELRRAGVQTVPSLQVLTEVLDSLRQVADEFMKVTSTRVLALSRRSPAPGAATGQTTGGGVGPAAGGTSWEQLDQDTGALTQSLAALLTEAFRVTVENASGGVGQSAQGPTPPTRSTEMCGR